MTKERHQLHNADTEECPVDDDERKGNGKYQSAWECTVCNQRWEDHETVREVHEDGASATAGKAGASGRRMRGGAGTWSSERASDIGKMLQENSYGVNGTRTDSDHYACRNAAEYADFKDQIQDENAVAAEKEREMESKRKKEGNALTAID